jgi:3-oxoadipate enol-lactonase
MTAISRLIQVNDGSLHVWDSNTQARPVVFLFHSLGTSGAMWAPQFESLGKSHRLIAMDCRGHGGTSCRGAFTIDACVDDAHEVFKALGVDSAHVVGLSMGGLMAAELAARTDTAKRVRSVTLACSYATLAGPSSQVRLEAARDTLARVSMTDFARQYMHDTATSSLDKKWRDSMIEVIGAMRSADYLATLKEILFHDCTPALGKISAPTMVLSGAQDRRVSEAATGQLAGAIAGVQAVRLEQAGHLANLEDPIAFDHALMRFWSGIDS